MHTENRRLYLILLAAVFFLPLEMGMAAPAADQFALNEDESRIMALSRSDGRILSEDFVIYQKGDLWLVPLGQFAYQLELALTISPKHGTVSGFVYDEQDVLTFDASTGEVLGHGGKRRVSPDRYAVGRDDIYIDIRLVSEWFPLAARLDLFASSIVITPLVTLPSQAAKNRELEAKLSDQPTPNGHPDLPRRTPAFTRLDGYYLDQDLSLGRGRQDQDHVATGLDHHTVAAASVYGWDARGEWNGNNHAVTRSRYGLARLDYDGQLLGALHAKEIRLVDFFYPGLPLISSGGEGRGVLLSNASTHLTDTFGSRTFNGYLSPGWEVNLFRNGVLLARQNVGDSGVYEFREIPLIYGMNQFRFVFYGPQGQRDERLELVDIDRSLLAPGKAEYFLALGVDENRQRKLEVQYDRGLSSAVSVMAGSARLLDAGLTGTESTYGNLGLRAIVPHVLLYSDTSLRSNGGHAAQIGARSPWATSSLGVRQIWLEQFSSPVFSGEDQGLARRTEASLDGYLAGEPSFFASLTEQFDEMSDTRRRTNLAATLGTSLRRLYLSNEVDWIADISGRKWQGKAISDSVLDRYEARVEIDYDRHGAAQSTLKLDTAWSPQWRSELTWQHAFAPSNHSLSLSLSQRLNACILAYSGQWNDKHLWQIATDISYGLGVDTDRGAAKFSADPVTDQGAIAIHVFLDRNNDGVMDPGDEELAGVGVMINGRRFDARTDQHGWLWITGLETERDLGVELNIETIEDPSYQPREKGFAVVLHRGSTFRAQVPVISTGEVEGVVWNDSGGKKTPRGGMKILVLEPNGKLVASTVNSSDGYYLIDKLPPGSYRLALDPKQLSTLGIAARISTQEITISGSGSILSGRDFSTYPR